MADNWRPEPGEIVWGRQLRADDEVKPNETIPGVPRPQARVDAYDDETEKVTITWTGGPTVVRDVEDLSRVPDEFINHSWRRQQEQDLDARSELPVATTVERATEPSFAPRWIRVIRCVGPEGSIQLKMGPIPDGQPRQVEQADLDAARKFYKGAFDADPVQTAGVVLPYSTQEDEDD